MPRNSFCRANSMIMITTGGDGEKRREADKMLFLRMLKVSQKDCRNPYALTWFTLIALLYYVSVRIFGRFYFNYKK